MNEEIDTHVSEDQASEVYELMEVDEDTDSEEEELLTSGEQQAENVQQPEEEQESEDEREALSVAASAQETSKSLFQLAKDPSINQETIATEWVEMYKECHSTALLRLMQLLVDASGSQYVIPAATAAPFKYTDILQAATCSFACVSKLYPLVAKEGHCIAAKLCSFMQCLVKAIYTQGEEPMPSNVCREFSSFILVFSDSKVRAFRHTSTLMGLQWMTALLAMGEAEKFKKLTHIWRRMLYKLFAPRRLDSVDAIRCLCCSEFLLWLMEYTAMAFDLVDSHMYCLFEALHDTSPKVRECCLVGVSQLYTSEPRVQRACLQLVKKYKQSVLLIAVADKEWLLCELAISLLMSCLRDSPGLLSEEEIATIEGLMFDQNRGVAQAAAELFVHQYLHRKEDEATRIRRVVTFFKRFPEHEHAAYLVDALIERSNVLLAWAPMVEMLLKEGEEEPQQNEDTIIIELLTHAVKQAITGEIPPGRYTKDLVQRLPMAGAKQRATRILAPVMAKLLRKHKENIVNVKNLLELPQYFELEAEESVEHLPQLIKRLQNIFYHQRDLSVIRTAVETLEKINMPATWQGIKEILSTAVTSYRMELRNWYATARTQATNKSRDNRLIERLQLVSLLFRHFDLTKCQLLPTALQSLEQCLSEADGRLPRGTIHLYLEICSHGLMWEQRIIMKDTATAEDIQERCEGLKTTLTGVIRMAFKVIKSMPNRSFPYALTTICDLFVLFGYHLQKHTNAAVSSLMYQPTIEDFELLEAHLMMHLFEAEEPKELRQKHAFDELHKKRQALAGYCKLVAFNVVPVMRFRFVLQFYDKFYDAFGDLMRSAMEKALDVNATNYGMTLMHTCLLVFSRVMNGEEPLDYLLNLAKRLAETLSGDLLNSRKGVLALHRAGIYFAAQRQENSLVGSPPQSLLFLSVLEKFVPQLLSQDKIVILKLLSEQIPAELPSCRREEWKPLECYRTALELALKFSCRRAEYEAMKQY
ncbi:cohesin subunit SA-1 [Drosophila guanche]|uniref:Blast:Cohesin subunit SA-1 n=1 Tax=Drosophila guanche TaxID=7266 RepID=A0A3B0K9P9_DROGU|nr:cohesin subunit SA-1 [Drosophila guanche]SPP84850.1 blast:Cohesin subunit SA-1 [Drosophila guanche]